MKSESNFATELLIEVRAGARRWFIIAIIELGIILFLVGMFTWYISLPAEVSSIEYTQEAIDNTLTDIQQTIGGALNGESKTDSSQNIQEKSNEK